MLVFSDVKQRLSAIPFCDVIWPLVATLHTSVQDTFLTRLILIPHRLHESTAGRQPIARVDINMFAPEALGTMVGIPVSAHLCPTVFADKIFLLTNEHILRAPRIELGSQPWEGRVLPLNHARFYQPNQWVTFCHKLVFSGRSSLVVAAEETITTVSSPGFTT